MVLVVADQFANGGSKLGLKFNDDQILGHCNFDSFNVFSF